MTLKHLFTKFHRLQKAKIVWIEQQLHYQQQQQRNQQQGRTILFKKHLNYIRGPQLTAHTLSSWDPVELLHVTQGWLELPKCLPDNKELHTFHEQNNPFHIASSLVLLWTDHYQDLGGRKDNTLLARHMKGILNFCYQLCYNDREAHVCWCLDIHVLHHNLPLPLARTCILTTL